MLERLSKGTKFIKTIVATLTLFSYCLGCFAEGTCSRTVEINSQEVSIDLNSTQKGEGLKGYLEKDPKANSYFEKYQEGNKFKWQDTLLGTGGTVVLLAGLSMGQQSGSKSTVIISGAALIVMQFILGYSLKKSNESNLEKAIDEYNKTNFPKINVSERDEKKLFLAHTWEF